MHASRHVALVAIGSVVLGFAACSDDDTTTTNSTTSSTANTTSSTNSSTASTSSTGGSGGGGTGTEDIAEFCQSTVDPFCEALFACCTDPTELAQWGGTVEACKTQTMTECETDLENELGPLYAMGLTDLDPDRLAACVSTLESLAAGACTEPPQLALFLCYTSFEGKVPAGQGCGAAGNDISWAECEEGYCDSGSCVAFLASNAPCTPGSDPAEYCNFTEGEWCLSATNTCGPRLAAGQPCLAVPENPECLSMSCPAGQCELPDAQQLCAEGG